MPPEQPPLHENVAQPQAPAPVSPSPTGAYEPIAEQERWLEEDEELPPRPRRRLLRPLPLALLGVLLTACGFIGGVLVEKGETSSGSTGSSAAAGAGLASRFAALRAATGAAGASSGGSSGTGAGSAGGFARPTSGTVAYLAGATLYVTDAEGNTVKVSTSPATSVTKTVKSDTKGIHPGEAVTIVGSTAANGAVAAESISVGSGAGGLAGLFGRSGSATGSGGAGGSSREASGAGPSLFGSG